MIVGSSLVSGVDRSYADAVHRFRGKESPNNAHEAGFNPILSNDKGLKDLHCSTVNVDLNWLRSCVVGRMVDTVTPVKVSELLKDEGIHSVSARPLGDNMVLLALVDGECIQEVMDDAKIAKEVGLLKLVDVATSQKERLEFFRLMISTRSWSRIEFSFDVVVLGKKFVVHVREE
ncbi:unnamed protein product [Lupinus luteus]|uniref:Uncharacterized protein n=1 Tax=Lupinus luteus TaxID=3873 RepID=A0AAV1Y479_LUPLU